jgi:hypothetical protein
MPLPRDPDVLRVPAFMRKRNLRVRTKKPLLLTALDRKQAGLVLKKPKKKKAPTRKKMESFSAPLLDFYAESFAEPIRESSPKLRRVGTLTHYYEKIKVGVMKLSSTLSVGDSIEYETDEGPYRQIVESLEINREPVFKAGRGKEIGFKLRKIPRLGCSVSMVK